MEILDTFHKMTTMFVMYSHWGYARLLHTHTLFLKHFSVGKFMLWAMTVSLGSILYTRS